MNNMTAQKVKTIKDKPIVVNPLFQILFVGMTFRAWKNYTTKVLPYFEGNQEWVSSESEDDSDDEYYSEDEEIIDGDAEELEPEGAQEEDNFIANEEKEEIQARNIMSAFLSPAPNSGQKSRASFGNDDELLNSRGASRNDVNTNSPTPKNTSPVPIEDYDKLNESDS
jgi:hypothetical protein